MRLLLSTFVPADDIDFFGNFFVLVGDFFFLLFAFCAVLAHQGQVQYNTSLPADLVVSTKFFMVLRRLAIHDFLAFLRALSRASSESRLAAASIAMKETMVSQGVRTWISLLTALLGAPPWVTLKR